MEKTLKALALATSLVAYPAFANTGKLVLTGGVSTIEGSAGGGLSPWAVIGTQATEGEWGVAPFVSMARTDDYDLHVAGAKWAWDERIELSFAQQRFDTGPVLSPLNLGGLDIQQNVFGAKVRIAGDAILDSDRWMPQVAVGVQHKRLDADGLEPVLAGLGADNSGTDYYVAATKLFLAPGILVNATLRATEANQGGLLGFGAQGEGYSVQPEIMVSKLLSNTLAVGGEYRRMPNNLNQPLNGALASDDWKSVFVAWAPHKQWSLTGAYVDLGRIVPGLTQARDQRGFYLSAQLSF